MPFRFVSERPSYDTSKVFYARLTKDIHKTEHLFEALYWILWLPGYFGFNWNALYDCLRDLSWIPDKDVVLEHFGLPMIAEDDLKIYLEILRDAVIDWSRDDGHKLEIIFYENDRERIRKILS